MNMGTFLSAGVYSREIDLSEIIPAVSTSSSAIVGASNRGSTAVQLMSNTQQFINEYGKPELGNYFHYSALAYLARGSVLYCRRVVNGALYGGLKVMESTSGDSNVALGTGAITPDFATVSGEDILFYVFGKDQGEWNSQVSVAIENSVLADFTFDIVVNYTDDAGVTAEAERWTVSRKVQTDGYGAQQYLEDKINGFSKYIVVADGPQADTVMPKENATAIILGGGINGSAPSDSDINIGWDDFANPDNIDIRILINGGETSTTVQTKMKEIAETRKDCIAVLDIPDAQLTSVSAMTTWRNATQNFNSSYCALYTPWLKVNDQYNDKIVLLPPSGYIAGQMAYNDAVADAWFAPAGFNRGLLNVLGVSNVFTQGDRDVLYSNGLNPIQMFRGEGISIWGQKTQQKKASALDRINVRRMLIVLEKAISIALRSFVFEPNSTLTRFRITAVIEEFLAKMAARGAFQTEGGDIGYKVVCDTTNNTPAIIDSNELKVDVFVKPSRTAEFIQLTTIVTKTGVSFQELIAQGTLI
jgi:hypothetical protein